MKEVYTHPITKIIIHYENGRILQLTGEAVEKWQKLQNQLLHSFVIDHQDENVYQEWEVIREKV